MDTAFVTRTLRASAWFGGLVCLLAAYYAGWNWSLGLALGTAWSMANLFLIKSLIERLIRTGERPWSAVLLLVLVKFPLLYLAGFLILRLGSYSPVAPLLGFWVPFVVMVLKALGRLLLGLQGSDAGRKPIGSLLK